MDKGTDCYAKEVQVENDYDGEMRQVDIEAKTLSVDGKVWRLTDDNSIKGICIL